MKRMWMAALCGLACTSGTIAADWGGISGQIVVTGKIPARILLHAKGAAIKDATVCAAADTYSDELIIDKESKGLANAFVYLAKAPKSIHPDLKEPAEKKVIFDQKGCAFLPHAMIVRAGQTVEVISSDSIAHNTHTYPIKNNAVNVLVAPNTPAGKGVDVACKLAERLPAQVKCDYHPWMVAYWMILDHPYAAITDKDGKFTIENLPDGDHEFVVWHEKMGYIERKYKAKVTGGTVSDLKPIEVPVAKLTAK